MIPSIYEVDFPAVPQKLSDSADSFPEYSADRRWQGTNFSSAMPHSEGQEINPPTVISRLAKRDEGNFSSRQSRAAEIEQERVWRYAYCNTFSRWNPTVCSTLTNHILRNKSTFDR